MKFATMLFLCTALLVANPGAQSKAGADPLSGAWTGTMGPSETQQRDIKVELKYDSKAKTITGVITGMPRPAAVTGGTFDAKTGALKLDAVVQNDAKTAVLFQGKLEKGTASGTVEFGDNRGTFSIAKDAPAKK